MAQKYIPNSLIRNRHTGKALFVIHVFRIATIVIDPTEPGFPVLRTLLPRDYPEWVRDTEMDVTEKNNYPEFHFHPINL